MGANEPWYVLEETPRRAGRLGDADDLPEEAAALAAEPGSLPGDGEVLAGEASDEEVKTTAEGQSLRLLVRSRTVGTSSFHHPGPVSPSTHVSGSLDAGPPGGEDALAESINLYLTDAVHPGTFQTKIESPYARK